MPHPGIDLKADPMAPTAQRIPHTMPKTHKCVAACTTDTSSTMGRTSSTATAGYIAATGCTTSAGCTCSWG